MSELQSEESEVLEDVYEEEPEEFEEVPPDEYEEAEEDDAEDEESPADLAPDSEGEHEENAQYVDDLEINRRVLKSYLCWVAVTKHLKTGWKT